VIEAEEKERARLSFDLHDGLGPDLSSLKLHIAAIKNSKTKKESNKIIDKSLLIIEESIANLRAISKSLSPHILKDYGIDVALREFCNSIERNNFQFEINTNIESIRLKDEIELSIYRIIKELINNSVKHSESDKVIIEIDFKENKINISYTDNGKGFDLKKLDSFDNIYDGSGIKNIKSRVESIGGLFEMITKVGKGVKVFFSVPIIR